MGGRRWYPADASLRIGLAEMLALADFPGFPSSTKVHPQTRDRSLPLRAALAAKTMQTSARVWNLFELRLLRPKQRNLGSAGL